MDNLKEQFSKAVNAFTAITEEVAPIAEGYYDFIRSGQIGRYTNDSVPADNSLYFDNFLPVAANPEEGISYHGEYLDYGDVYEYQFTVPYAYFEDPETWKQETLAKYHAIEATVEKALISVYPDLEEQIAWGEYTIKINFYDWTEGETLIGADLQRKTHHMFAYRGVLQGSNHFFVNLNTSDIYQVDYPHAQKADIEAGMIKPTTEPRNDD